MSAKDFLGFIIGSLVESPDQVSIEEKHDELGTLLSLRVSPDDMGTIIGREGKTVNAIRSVLRVYGSKTNERVNLKIVEEK